MMVRVASLIAIVAGIAVAVALFAPLGVVLIILGILGLAASYMSGAGEQTVSQDDIDAQINEVRKQSTYQNHI
jgi:heme O synthase-like polyprenyltransferase